MATRNSLIAIRLLFGVVALLAIGSQLVVHIGEGHSVVNFFSYFTNLSNFFAAVVLVLIAVDMARGKVSNATGDFVRGSSVVCMALVGAVFSVLLRNVDLGSLQPWVNTVLHFIMPIYVVLDWLIQPPSRPLVLRRLWVWLIPPVAYLAYSLIRGAIVNWYAYPFLNPASAGGYGGVTLYCLAITVAFLAMSALLAFLANKLRPLVPARAAAV